MLIDIIIQEKLWRQELPTIRKITKDCIKISLCSPALGCTDSNIKDNAEICILLADDQTIQDLNKRFRGKDTPTNVLSFPQSEPNTLPILPLGDIVLSYQTIQKEAYEQNKNFVSHFKHLLVHGVLHLMHYDHQNDQEAKIMEDIEIKILDSLGIKNPYETPVTYATIPERKCKE